MLCNLVDLTARKHCEFDQHCEYNRTLGSLLRLCGGCIGRGIWISGVIICNLCVDNMRISPELILIVGCFKQDGIAYLCMLLFFSPMAL
jgi:hypothetical protein